MIKTKRWFLGVQSRKDAAVIMIEVCRTIQLLGYEWFLENEYQIRCRQRIHLNHVDHMTEMRLQLYKVQEHAYLLDFQKLDGNVCSFMHMCGTVIDQLQKGLSRNAQLMCREWLRSFIISSCNDEVWLVYITTRVCSSIGASFLFDGVNSLRIASDSIQMICLCVSLLLAVLCQSAVVEKVWIRPSETTGNTVSLSSSSPATVSISSLQQAMEVGLRFCPPTPNTKSCSSSEFTHRYDIAFVVKGMNHESLQFHRQFQASSTDCSSVSSSVFSDGDSYWYATQGKYSIVISVHDSSPYALFSTSYSLVIVRPSSLQFRVGSTLSNGQSVSQETLKETPISLSLPSSIVPTSVRWMVDGAEAASTTKTS